MAALGLVHVVGRHQDRGAGVREVEQLLPETAPRFRVDRTGRLVEEQQLRRMHDRAGQRQALLLPAAHGAGELRRLRLQVVGLEQGVDPLAARRARQALHAGEEQQVLAHAEVLVQRELLGHVPHPPPQGLGLRRDAQAEHLDLAGAGGQQPAQHADGGGLPGSVRAEEAVHRRARHRQVDRVDRLQRAEALAQATRADRERAVSDHPQPPRTRPGPGPRAAGRSAHRAPLRRGSSGGPRRRQTVRSKG